MISENFERAYKGHTLTWRTALPPSLSITAKVTKNQTFTLSLLSTLCSLFNLLHIKANLAACITDFDILIVPTDDLQLEVMRPVGSANEVSVEGWHIARRGPEKGKASLSSGLALVRNLLPQKVKFQGVIVKCVFL
jgi:hypothetical protein